MTWDNQRCEYCDEILSKNHHCKYMDMSDTERIVQMWREENGLDDNPDAWFDELVKRLEEL